MTDTVFATGYKNESFWWEDAPRPDRRAGSLPAKVDVLVIGSGYTGLMAAWETAKGGRSTLVVDAEAAGFGCSSRNGGQVSTSIKPTLSELSGRMNEEIARGVRQEGIDSLAYVTDLVETQKLDCDWRVVGRYHAAHNPKQFDALAKAMQTQPQGLVVPYEIVTRAEQSKDIDTAFYHGGVVYPKHASLHPGKYHLELLRLSEGAGAQVVSYCPVTHLDKDPGGFVATTPLGRVNARDVVVATNGYTGPLTPWHRRRVIPIGSYIIATEELPLEQTARLLPTDRVISDTRKLVFYYRLSPDKRRIIFGGRVAYMENDPKVSAPRLHYWMSLVFPELKATRVSHSWMGYVAYTFDTLPHLGQQDGLYYAMGYCGSGISLATYFGAKIGQQVLGKKEGMSPLNNVPFQTRPLYEGNPWFLAPSILYYRIRDSLPI
ncbi:glycine/D-amino acid oxidase-like deaminating enzyme [Dongia mobilis]|uniref:Glycine/D-amino acid oxidase-like deaminating enzyme n=1 Tax=Dongia mobilis TaxID=578943 RepID=A0A4R6WFI3_9PROT|nr:FAD-binding oxidoreductase [Dongia mobilis]TDQ78819.1 glycine/D-amino acid oxidase-like deaminating enzyme [Dongia mobilis]